MSRSSLGKRLLSNKTNRIDKTNKLTDMDGGDWQDKTRHAWHGQRWSPSQNNGHTPRTIDKTRHTCPTMGGWQDKTRPTNDNITSQQYSNTRYNVLGRGLGGSLTRQDMRTIDIDSSLTRHSWKVHRDQQLCVRWSIHYIFTKIDTPCEPMERCDKTRHTCRQWQQTFSLDYRLAMSLLCLALQKRSNRKTTGRSSTSLHRNKRWETWPKQLYTGNNRLHRVADNEQSHLHRVGGRARCPWFTAHEWGSSGMQLDCATAWKLSI